MMAPTLPKRREGAARSRLINLLLAAMLVVGLGLLAYPTFSDYWNCLHQSRAIAGYVQRVADMSAEQYEDMWRKAQAYNQELAGQADRYHPTEEMEERYASLLDVTGTGIMGYVDIPKIGVSLPIYHGTDEAVLQIAVGHIEGTSLPVGGAGTHCVISGHRGLPSAKLFTDITQLTEGDTFCLQVLDRTLTYEVDQIRIVWPDELEELEMEAGKDYCTLVTCTPYGINTHRLLVRGRRVEKDEALMHITADALQIDPRLVSPVIAIPFLLLMAAGALFGWRSLMPKKRKTKKDREKKDRLGRLLVLCLLWTGLSLFGGMRTQAAQTQGVRLTVNYPLEQAPIRLYRVADLGDTGAYQLRGSFSAYASQLTEIGGQETEGWSRAASTLKNLITAEAIAPDAERPIQGGKAVFEALSPALYLVLSPDAEAGGELYIASGTLLSLPRSGDGQGGWAAQEEITMKYTHTPITGQPKRYRVVKYWETLPTETIPASVTVRIYRTKGTKTSLYREVTLQEENNYIWEWEYVDDGSSFSLKEAAVKDFTVTVDAPAADRGVTVLSLTNTSAGVRGERKPGETEPGGKTPGGSTSGGSAAGGNGAGVRTGDGTPLERYAVLLLSAAGAALLLAGMKSRKARDS